MRGQPLQPAFACPVHHAPALRSADRRRQLPQLALVLGFRGLRLSGGRRQEPPKRGGRVVRRVLDPPLVLGEVALSVEPLGPAPARGIRRPSLLARLHLVGQLLRLGVGLASLLWHRVEEAAERRRAVLRRIQQCPICRPHQRVVLRGQPRRPPAAAGIRGQPALLQQPHLARELQGLGVAVPLRRHRSRAVRCGPRAEGRACKMSRLP
mmetsp:Transcript_59370/g.181073  ORF Transcript_59370/g.181073 Transcript_59370/m.181073 type:complete len:209 (-) Transcript_59370:2-628(-)